MRKKKKESTTHVAHVVVLIHQQAHFQHTNADSAVLGEATTVNSQTSLTAPLWVEKYTLNVSRSTKALTGNTNGIWVPKYCRYH